MVGQITSNGFSDLPQKSSFHSSQNSHSNFYASSSSRVYIASALLLLPKLVTLSINPDLAFLRRIE